MTDFFRGIVSDTTWSSWFVAIVVIYYTALWLVALGTRRSDPINDFQPAIALLVPARNEELVITDTVEALLRLDYDEFVVVVLDDGSTDRTAELVATIAARDQRVVLVRRSAEIAGTGKSDVLNHGFEIVKGLLADGDPRLKGRDATEVLIGIVDADGFLDRQTLRTVAPYFEDPNTGQLQIGVKIYNADENILTRMQDMEFVGFTSLVQVARDRIGSSGLGGNGQFTRLAALLDLGGEPWNPRSLTEDLDLGIRLVLRGWVTRFTSTVSVHQQGLTKWRPLLRQRTRWIQGHYQCWRYMPSLARTREARLVSRLDLINYLFLVVTVVVVTFNLIVGLLGAFGVIDVRNYFLTSIPVGPWRRAVEGFFVYAPIVAFTYTYQRHSDHRLRWWEVPAYGLIFTLYSYVWITVTIRAWTRLLLRRNSWTKTPRVARATQGLPESA